jgi:hypothetical protein
MAWRIIGWPPGFLPQRPAGIRRLGPGLHPTARAELTDFMKKESTKWGTIVRERKISDA